MHRCCKLQLKVPIRIAFLNSNHIDFCDSYPNTVCILCASSILNAIRIQKCKSNRMQIAFWMRVSSLCAIFISHRTCIGHDSYLRCESYVIEHDSHPRCESYVFHANRIWMRLTSTVPNSTIPFDSDSVRIRSDKSNRSSSVINLTL